MGNHGFIRSFDPVKHNVGLKLVEVLLQVIWLLGVHIVIRGTLLKFHSSLESFLCMLHKQWLEHIRDELLQIFNSPFLPEFVLLHLVQRGDVENYGRIAQYSLLCAVLRETSAVQLCDLHFRSVRKCFVVRRECFAVRTVRTVELDDRRSADVVYFLWHEL